MPLIFTPPPESPNLTRVQMSLQMLPQRVTKRKFHHRDGPTFHCSPKTEQLTRSDFGFCIPKHSPQFFVNPEQHLYTFLSKCAGEELYRRTFWQRVFGVCRWKRVWRSQSDIHHDWVYSPSRWTSQHNSIGTTVWSFFQSKNIHVNVVLLSAKQTKFAVNCKSGIGAKFRMSSR